MRFYPWSAGISKAKKNTSKDFQRRLKISKENENLRNSSDISQSQPQDMYH